MESFFRTILAAAACATVLAGCGGSGGAAAPAPATSAASVGTASLTGTWSSERQGTSGTYYVNEQLIKDNGDNLVITSCDRSTVTLKRTGNQLFDSTGALYELYVKDENTLTTRPELSYTSTLTKRSATTAFTSGKAGLGLSSDALTQQTDVCANVSIGRYENAAQVLLFPTKLTVTLPYRDSYATAVFAFSQLDSAHYTVVDYEAFFKTAGATVTANMSSPAFAGTTGNNALTIVSGSLDVTNYTATTIQVSADLVTAAGLPVKFTADLKLPPRS